MYAVVWEYSVRQGAEREFAETYGARGTWAQLFGREEGFVGTELFRSAEGQDRFLTIDRWRSREDFDRFKERFGADYDAIDARCEALTVSERRLGELAP
jgi:heme-degrading monooxygenase HmoA